MTAILDHENNIESLRIPPHSIEAEQYVLGAMFIDENSFYEIQGDLKVEDFYRQDHRLIFEAVEQVVENGSTPDILVMSEYLKEQGQLENAGGLAYLGTLAKDSFTSANIKRHAEIIANHAKRRRLISLGFEISEDSFEYNSDPVDIISKQSASMDAILEGSSNSEYSMEDLHKESFETIKENNRVALSRGVTGIPTGIGAIDKRLGGWQKKRLYILAARPGVGKTAFSNQIAIHAAMNGYKVGILSLEMGADELGIRAFANFYQVNVSALSFGNTEEIGKLGMKMKNRKEQGLPLLKDAQMWVDTDTYSLAEVSARMTQWKRKHDIDLVIVDHIGLIETKDETKSRNDQLGKISRTLKKMSKRLDISILALSQLNRESEKHKRRPQMSDLRDSGNIEQDADSIIFLHVNPDDKGLTPIPFHIGMDKVRYGVPGWIMQKNNQGDIVEESRFRFDGRTQTIHEIDYVTNEPRL